jgi:hypothetical protein
MTRYTFDCQNSRFTLSCHFPSTSHCHPYLSFVNHIQTFAKSSTAGWQGMLPNSLHHVVSQVDSSHTPRPFFVKLFTQLGWIRCRASKGLDTSNEAASIHRGLYLSVCLGQ